LGPGAAATWDLPAATTTNGKEQAAMGPKASTAPALGVLSLIAAMGVAVAADGFTLRVGASGALAMPLDGAAAAVLQLGLRADALNGDDPLDVLAPPPPPAGGMPFLYVSALAPQVGQYWHDFRALAASQSWELNLAGMAPGNSVTLIWVLEDGSLGGVPLRLLDRRSGSVLVPDMTATREFLCPDVDRALLVAYGSSNQPPLAHYDRVFMLESAASLGVPFDLLLANDVDPDGGTLEVVGVGAPGLPATGSRKGGAEYGTATLDAGNRSVTYTQPATLPSDWIGLVEFEYTVRDNGTPSPAQSTALIQLGVAPHVVQDPDRRRLALVAGQTLDLRYTLRYADTLQALRLEYLLPLAGSGQSLRFWPYAGSYQDNAPGSDPVIDAGNGPDGVPGTDDDTGIVRLDFGTDLPPSGTQLSFRVRCPEGPATEAGIQAVARYRLGTTGVSEYCQALADVTVAASRYIPDFVAGPGGTVTVEHGDTCSTATAHPDTGHHFVRWLRNGAADLEAPALTACVVTVPTTFTAEYAINTYTASFGAGPGGTLEGVTSQQVAHGGDTTPVRALANGGYRFVDWSDGRADNPRTDTAVTASFTVTARFAILPGNHTVTFAAGAHGAIQGATPQVVADHGSTSAVSAVPSYTFVFERWSDGSTANPRTVSDVTADATYTAQFRAAGSVPPVGAFTAQVGKADVGDGRGWWDLSGTYALTVGGHALALRPVEDTKGKITGGSDLALGKAAVLGLPIKGSAKGKAGALAVKLGLKGARTDPAASAALTLTLTLNAAACQLTGPATGTISQGGVASPVSETVSPAIPPPMDGTWTLAFQLVQSGTAVTGTATLTLSNGVDYACTAKGKTGMNGTAVLSLAGDKADPAAKAIKIKATITPLEGGWARVESFSGKGYGQSVGW